MVLEWSPTNEQFQTTGNRSPKYWQWYFKTFIFTCFIGFGPCIDVFTNRKEAGISLSIISFGFASMSFLFWASTAVIIWKVDEFVAGLGYLNNACHHIGKLFQFISSILSFHFIFSRLAY